MRPRTPEPLAAFDAADAADPADPDAHAGRGAALFARDRFADSVAAFTAALELRPDDPALLRGRGKAHFENAAHAAAVADLEAAIARDPADAEAHAYRAAAYHDLGKEEDEIDGFYDDLIQDALAEALRLNPDLPCAYFFRGRLLADYEDQEGALADFDRALDLDPDYAYPYHHRANVWSAWGEAEKSLADRGKYLEMKPTASAFHGQAHSWQSAGNDEMAAHCFAEAIRLEPESTRHYSCRANLWQSMGEDDKADADFETIERLQDAENRELDMNATVEQRMRVFNLIQEHFGGTPLEDIEVTSREFPARVGADLQLALDRLAGGGFEVVQFWTLHQCGQAPHNFSQLYTKDRRNPPLPVPPEYVETDVGEADPVRCLKFGVWLVADRGANLLVMLDTQNHRGIHFQVAAVRGADGQAAVARFFAHLEDGIKTGSCYRGKVLSLEYQDSYSGQQYGILVHKIRPVLRDEVILPPATLALLERNVIQFVRQRAKLAKLGLATKKGLLFYGPPGTGKTHTLHYLARGIEGQTTFLVTAEQVGMLSEYMTLARLFQPSMLVIEDVDLIARDRTTMHTPGEEVLLNKLLNEMDGLKPETDILFVLTTNRPEKLEAALSSRPGRIDQAIEFPLPDEGGRAKLVRLYSRSVEVPDEVVAAVVKRTDRVSASFIKELMRRATQFYLERDGDGALTVADVSAALEEMMVRGGSLNRVLLGAGDAVVTGFAPQS